MTETVSPSHVLLRTLATHSDLFNIRYRLRCISSKVGDGYALRLHRKSGRRIGDALRFVLSFLHLALPTCCLTMCGLRWIVRGLYDRDHSDVGSFDRSISARNQMDH